MGFSVWLLSQTRTSAKFIVSEARFHAESIGASHVSVIRKTTKLFKFLQPHSQRERTIALVIYMVTLGCYTTEPFRLLRTISLMNL